MPRSAPLGQQGTEQPTRRNAKRDANRDVERAMPSAYDAASAAGIQISPSKMRRILRAGISSQQEVEQENGQRRIAYRDTTGETAVRNVMRGTG